MSPKVAAVMVISRHLVPVMCGPVSELADQKRCRPTASTTPDIAGQPQPVRAICARRADGASSPRARARSTASWRLWTPSLAYR
jgi:hypothetical protein